MSKTTTREPTMTAIPANEFDATPEPVFSVYAPHFFSSKLISKDINYASARKVADHYGALVYLTADLPAAP